MDLVSAIRRELRRAIRTTVRRARRDLQGETIYGVSLAIEARGGGVAGVAIGTRERLARTVDDYLEVAWGGRTRAQLRDMLRWNCDDGWRFYFDGFERASGLLSQLVDGVDDGGVEDMYPSRLAYLLLHSALAEADYDGLFGRGRERAQVVLNLYAGDQSDAELLEWATPINPSVKRLAAELRRGSRASARP